MVIIKSAFFPSLAHVWRAIFMLIFWYHSNVWDCKRQCNFLECTIELLIQIESVFDQFVPICLNVLIRILKKKFKNKIWMIFMSFINYIKFLSIFKYFVFVTFCILMTTLSVSEYNKYFILHNIDTRHKSHKKTFSCSSACHKAIYAN